MSVTFYAISLKPLFHIILIMFFIVFPTLSYPIQSHSITSIEYTKPYSKPNQANLYSYMQIILFYGFNTMPIKSWVFKLNASSFSQLYLCIQPPVQSPQEIRLSNSGKFQLPILLLLVEKIILAIPTNTPFLYTLAIFHAPIFVYNQPNNLH